VSAEPLCDLDIVPSKAFASVQHPYTNTLSTDVNRIIKYIFIF
jgi:hypothetical protein